MISSQSFSRNEKLKGRKNTTLIFREGKTFLVYPLKVFYVVESDDQPVVLKAGVGVSTRNFKKAVDRNRIKRLLRECFRKEKSALQSALLQGNKKALVFFLYVGKEMPDYSFISRKMKKVIQLLINNIDEESA